jgi:hypothetical protein
MNPQLKTIKRDGAEWVRLTKAQSKRLDLESCWVDGLMVDVNVTNTSTIQDSVYFNCDPLGPYPVCEYWEWTNCSFAPDELVDVLVAARELAPVKFC